MVIAVGSLVVAVVASMVDVAAVGSLVVAVVASMVDVAAVGSLVVAVVASMVDVVAVGSLVVAVVASMVDVAAIGMLVVDTGALAFPSASATVKRQIIVVTCMDSNIHTLESLLTVSIVTYLPSNLSAIVSSASRMCFSSDRYSSDSLIFVSCVSVPLEHWLLT